MRLTPWLLSITLGIALFATAGNVLAEPESGSEKHNETLDDAALEEKYGIKAGAVQREESTSTEASDTKDAENSDAENNGDEEEVDAGTGGTGSAQADMESSEAEESLENNE